MANIHQVITLGIGTPASITHLILFGLTPPQGMVASVSLTGTAVSSAGIVGTMNTAVEVTGSYGSPVEIPGTIEGH